jgi:ABC-type Fe3+-hydroxamate transport system substrate-binding protein
MKNAGLLLTASALLLAACGSETSGEFTTAEGEKAEYTIDEDSGETSMTVKGPDGTATLRSGAEVPVSLPDGFSLYPGSKVVTNTVVDQPDGQGTMVMFEATAPADKIVAHYREQAKAAGFDIQLEMNTNGTTMIGGERKGDGSTLSVTATSGDTTTGQIIIGTKKSG